MTRRLQTCGRCGGRTRHADRRCSRCRRGLPVVRLLREAPRDLRAPTVAELNAGMPIGHMVEGYSFSGARLKWARPVRRLEVVVDVDDSVTVVDFRGRGA